MDEQSHFISKLPKYLATVLYHYHKTMVIECSKPYITVVFYNIPENHWSALILEMKK